MSSHPAWVRGLKLRSCFATQPIGVVAPCVGAWIETLKIAEGRHSWMVAPCVGAWIETKHGLSSSWKLTRSHPAWVRGLKQARAVDASWEECRTLRGCVD